MVRSAPGDVDRIRREVERALRGNLDAEEVLPLLARLARAAAPESEDWLYAHRHLAELGVEHDPWRAALFARRVLAHRPSDDGAWAVLGLAQSLLGHFRFAAHAYEKALALAPTNPWYAHNLGHLYDVALDRAGDALPLLAMACDAQPDEADIAASYAHALARCGKVSVAKRVLKRAIRRGATADQMALWRWLDAGAPANWTGRPNPRSASPSEGPPSEGPDAPPGGAGHTEEIATGASGDVVGRKKPRRRRPRARAGS